MTDEAWKLQGPILLVGAGKMGGALLEGWLAAGVQASDIRVVEPKPSAEFLALCRANRLAVEREAERDDRRPPSVIVMAVKPQVMDAVFEQIAPLAGGKTVTLSIAAGKPIASFEKHLATASAVVRAMPNTPASIGRGITVLCANHHTFASEKKLCERLMSAVGEVGWVEDETLMDAVTAVSGSGPAYVFLLAEALAEAGIKAGLPVGLAEKLARETVAGSGELLHQAVEVSAAQLRQNVTSPGGTTAAALDVLMGSDGLPALLERAVAAAVARGKALAKG